MGRQQSMKLEQRQHAIGMLHGGMTITAVANRFRVSLSTISRHWTSIQQDNFKTGHHRKTTLRQDHYLVVTSRRNPFMSAQKLAARLYLASWTRVTA